MKQFILSATLIAASAIMVSCEKESTPANDDGIVRFTSGITATPTRVGITPEGESVWEQNDPVGIYMVEHGTDVVADNAANMKYMALSGGAVTPFVPAGSIIYYPTGEMTKVDFIAYHPYAGETSNWVYSVDISDQSSQTAIDLLWAKADKYGLGYDKTDSQSGAAVVLTFDHKLVKLILRVTKDASVTGEVTTVKINGMNTRANFDLKSADGIMDLSDEKSFAPFTVTPGSVYEAILLPAGSLDAGHTVTFTTGQGESYTWSMSLQIPKLEAGKIYDYTITMSKYRVTASGTINSWKVGSTGTGMAE